MGVDALRTVDLTLSRTSTRTLFHHICANCIISYPSYHRWSSYSSSQFKMESTTDKTH